MAFLRSRQRDRAGALTALRESVEHLDRIGDRPQLVGTVDWGIVVLRRFGELETAAVLVGVAREGPLAEFRDPTGRMFMGATVFPFSRGRFAAGATVDYERALPGAGRLPSSVGASLVGRFRLRQIR